MQTKNSSRTRVIVCRPQGGGSTGTAAKAIPHLQSQIVTERHPKAHRQFPTFVTHYQRQFAVIFLAFPWVCYYNEFMRKPSKKEGREADHYA